MKTMYLIVAGHYSDKFTDGYCTTRELAEKVCALRNGGSPYNDYRVEEVECLDDSGAQVERIYTNYSFSFKLTYDGWKVGNAGTYNDGKSTSTAYKAPSVEDMRNGWERAVIVSVCMKEPNYNVARKIAIDTFYQWRSEHPDKVIE